MFKRPPKLFQIDFEDISLEPSYLTAQNIAYLLQNATGRKVLVNELSIPVNDSAEKADVKENKNVKKSKLLPDNEKRGEKPQDLP